MSSPLNACAITLSDRFPGRCKPIDEAQGDTFGLLLAVADPATVRSHAPAGIEYDGTL